MAWVCVEREQFLRMCEKGGVSIKVRDAIRAWAPTVSNKYETPRSKLIYRSPNNNYEAWSAGIPNPDSNKGKSGGYRVVYFLDLDGFTINLDFIEERKELGFKNEGHRKKDKYNYYVDGLKEYLKRLDVKII
ncbi:MAG: hypothetical protein NTW11_02950 [Candidatus Staskawiczbacteria bacterium]|nr:hypothetical protein [Candidatus Staskawiczbacteria bacterium]